MSFDNEMYCTLCNGRGLDRYDQRCRKCQGTGYEPDTLASRREAPQYLPRILINNGRKNLHS